MSQQFTASIDPQTTRIEILVAPRPDGTLPGQMDITVIATKSKVVHDENGAVVGVLGTETKVLSNVATIESFPATYAALKAAIDAEFTSPAPEGDGEGEGQGEGGGEG